MILSSVVKGQHSGLRLGRNGPRGNFGEKKKRKKRKAVVVVGTGAVGLEPFGTGSALK
jgi:hypothetical protein